MADWTEDNVVPRRSDRRMHALLADKAGWATTATVLRAASDRSAAVRPSLQQLIGRGYLDLLAEPLPVHAQKRVMPRIR